MLSNNFLLCDDCGKFLDTLSAEDISEEGCYGALCLECGDKRFLKEVENGN